MHYEKEEYLLGNKWQDGKDDHRNKIAKSSDNKRLTNILSRHTLQDGLLANELLSSLRKVRFNKQEFSSGKPISDIKYHHLGSENNNLFHPFNNQLNYKLVKYFA